MSISTAPSSAYLGTGSSDREGDESINYHPDCSSFPSIFYQRKHSHLVASKFLAVLHSNLIDTQKNQHKTKPETKVEKINSTEL